MSVVIFCFLFFYCCSSTVVSIFTLLPPYPHPHLPPLNLPSLFLSICPFYMFFDGPSPFIPYYPSPSSSLVTVSLFFILMSLVIFCLLVCFFDQVPLIGEIIWHVSFTSWLVSLSVMLSSSIHAVAKGRSFFFLSAIQYSIV